MHERFRLAFRNEKVLGPDGDLPIFLLSHVLEVSGAQGRAADVVQQ